jgi:hypothetical protein
MAKGHTPIMRPGSQDTSYRINLAPRKDNLCPYEQKNMAGFISVHKKAIPILSLFPIEQFSWEYCSSGFQHQNFGRVHVLHSDITENRCGRMDNGQVRTSRSDNNTWQKQVKWKNASHVGKDRAEW